MPETTNQQQPHSLTKTITKTIACRYLLFLPQDYRPDSAPWPLMMFLHGAGERGDDLNLVKRYGPPLIADRDPDFPFVLVSPQCPDDYWWSGDTLITLLDEISATCNVDPNRVYLTGLSMGGYGTWNLACEFPHRFAAIAPICGRGEPFVAPRIKHLPVWAFHGAQDEVVGLYHSEKMVRALKACGGKVKFTVYPDTGHDAWTQTYNNPKLYQWFLSHKKPNP